MFIIIIACIIIIFALFSFIKELKNYRHGIMVRKAKRRMTINVCLFIVAVALAMGYADSTGLGNQHALLFWGFLLLLMLAIIWLAWIDLKEGLKDVERNAMEEMVKMIHEIKKEEKEKENNRHEYYH